MQLTDDDGELFSFVLTDFSTEMETTGNHNQKPASKHSAGFKRLHCTENIELSDSEQAEHSLLPPLPGVAFLQGL